MRVVADRAHEEVEAGVWVLVGEGVSGARARTRMPAGEEGGAVVVALVALGGAFCVEFELEGAVVDWVDADVGVSEVLLEYIYIFTGDGFFLQ